MRKSRRMRHGGTAMHGFVLNRRPASIRPGNRSLLITKRCSCGAPFV
jgi:hypothetical protein